MKVFLLLAMLAVCASGCKDLTGQMFTFQTETNSACVKLITTKQDFSAVTVCHRTFTDLERDHALFSLATPSHDNDFLVFWDQAKQWIAVYVNNKVTGFKGFDYELNSWHSICTTWDSQSGLVQLWFDGQPSIRKFITPGLKISGPPVIILGQEQDSHGGRFDIKQSFVGMISDVHMWDYILTPCEIQNYVNDQNFTPGNVVNWRSLDNEIVGDVLTEYEQITCS